MTNCCNLYPYCFFLSSFCVVRHVRLCFLNNFYCDILHRIQYCDSYVLSSVTSVNLKKAGMASRNIVLKKHFAVKMGWFEIKNNTYRPVEPNCYFVYLMKMPLINITEFNGQNLDDNKSTKCWAIISIFPLPWNGFFEI